MHRRYLLHEYMQELTSAALIEAITTHAQTSDKTHVVGMITIDQPQIEMIESMQSSRVELTILYDKTLSRPYLKIQAQVQVQVQVTLVNFGRAQKKFPLASDELPTMQYLTVLYYSM